MDGEDLALGLASVKAQFGAQVSTLQLNQSLIQALSHSLYKCLKNEMVRALLRMCSSESRFDDS